MKNLILIGARGAGKSKISRVLSKSTERPVLSTDQIAIYKLGGIPISSYIQSPNGSWKFFRELEYQILTDLKSAEGIILDCGGGILFDLDESGTEVYSHRKASILHSLGPVIYLKQPIPYLIDKVVADASRPSLSSVQSYESILNFRLPFYEKSADLIVDIENLSKEKAGNKILNEVKNLR